MKTIKLLVLGVLFITGANLAQAQVSINVNLGAPPAWGPAGYSAVDYYYLPDVESYYDVKNSQFIYLGNGKWIRAKNLPTRYRNYDLYSGYKVVLNDYHGRTPYNHFKNHKVKYYKGYKGKPQKNIGYYRGHQSKAHKNSDYNKNKNKSYEKGKKNHDKHKN